jgi:hypothetical protein
MVIRSLDPGRFVLGGLHLLLLLLFLHFVGVAAHQRRHEYHFSCEDFQSLEMEDGGRYLGSVVSGSCDDITSERTLPHGYGVMEYAANDQHGRNRYTGQFHCGERQGRGRLVWSDTSSYVGDFHRGSRTGQGRMEYPNGHIYDGEWKVPQKNKVTIFTLMFAIKKYTIILE